MIRETKNSFHFVHPQIVHFTSWANRWEGLLNKFKTKSFSYDKHNKETISVVRTMVDWDLLKLPLAHRIERGGECVYSTDACDSIRLKAFLGKAVEGS